MVVHLIQSNVNQRQAHRDRGGEDLRLMCQQINPYQVSYRNAAVTHIYGCQIPKGDVQLQSNLYPYNIAVESEQEGGEGVFVLPNVADFVQ